MMNFGVITLFPDIFNLGLGGLVQSAQTKGVYNLQVQSLRDFGKGTHKIVDDEPYGGGDGMLLKPEILEAALVELQGRPGLQTADVVYLSPKGKLWNQGLAQTWAQERRSKILICGRYAGVDQRFVDQRCHEEISIGDYVLNGGETAALVVLESVIRLLEGVLGNQDSALYDSLDPHYGLLEAPQYTRPAEWQGHGVPPTLLSGHHEKIKAWKHRLALLETAYRRPDLLRPAHYQELSQILQSDEVFDKECLQDFGESKVLYIKQVLRSQREI